MESQIDRGWRKSSYSGNGGGNCIEAASTAQAVLVRDTQDRQGPVLRFDAEVWRRFASKVKADLAQTEKKSAGRDW